MLIRKNNTIMQIKSVYHLPFFLFPFSFLFSFFPEVAVQTASNSTVILMIMHENVNQICMIIALQKELYRNIKCSLIYMHPLEDSWAQWRRRRVKGCPVEKKKSKRMSSGEEEE